MTVDRSFRIDHFLSPRGHQLSSPRALYSFLFCVFQTCMLIRGRWRFRSGASRCAGLARPRSSPLAHRLLWGWSTAWDARNCLGICVHFSRGVGVCAVGGGPRWISTRSLPKKCSGSYLAPPAWDARCYLAIYFYFL